MSERTELREPFSDEVQQHEAAMLGMYVFLATEIMLFGGLFAGALAYRILYPVEIVEASERLHLFIAAANTAVLLTSSFTMALAVGAARRGQRSAAVRRLAATSLLGAAFLAIKGFEYSLEYGEGLLPGLSPEPRFSGAVEHLFMNLYLVATGLHAVHLLIGIILVGGLALRIWIGSMTLPRRAVDVEVIGLFWHLIDVVWVFLYPVLYLAR